MEDFDIDDLQDKDFYPKFAWPSLVTGYLSLNPKTRWLCLGCEGFISELTSKQQIINYLKDFLERKYKVCKQCRVRNYFEINQNSEITFKMIDKPKK